MSETEKTHTVTSDREPTSEEWLKRMRQECAADDCYGLSSDNKEEFLESAGQRRRHPARVSMGYTEEPV